MNRTAASLRRRLAGAVASLATVTLALTGCTAFLIPDDPYAAREVKAPDTEGVAEELLPFYSQELEWESCEGNLPPAYDCTTVTAPRDWENPEAGDLELAVIRMRTKHEPMGSLLTNPGGPGQSGFEMIAMGGDYMSGVELAENYDVIGFDPRGVGRSTAVTCFDAEEMDAYLYDIPEAERGTTAWEDELLDGHRAFAAACEENSDGILPFITTVNAARDMDLIRAVLGDKKLNYIGYSYGTFLGATYANLYPEKVGHLLLDGAIDPAVNDVGVTQALGFESALRAYMENCLSTESCPFNGTVDEAIGDLQALLASLDRRPLKNGDGRELGADTMITAIITPLYSESSWGALSQLLSGVLQGDATTAFLVADQYNGRTENGYADNSSEAFRAYNCMDYPTENDPAADEAAMKKIAEGAPTFAPYWDGPDSCSVWPYPPTGTRGEIHAEGSGPILVLGTTNDPATPYEWSVSLAEQLQEGVLITREGEGHTGYNKGNSCVDDAVVGFFLDDTVPEDGLTC